MTEIEKLDRIAIDVRSRKLLYQLLDENPEFEEILRNSKNETEVVVGVREWIKRTLKDRENAFRFYHARHSGRELFDSLEWRDYAIIRILDYIDNAGNEYPDLNLRREIAVSNPLRLIWLAVNKGTGGAKPDFFIDMIMLFRQLRGESEQAVFSAERVSSWMDRYPSGLDPRIVRLREENRQRIIRILVEQIDRGEVLSQKYFFEPGLDQDKKLEKVEEWWQDYRFHLRFAIRSPELLNEMMDHSLDPDTMKILKDAQEAGIPFFINPYYLSLLHVRVPYFAVGADLAIRYYVLIASSLWKNSETSLPGRKRTR